MPSVCPRGGQARQGPLFLLTTCLLLFLGLWIVQAAPEVEETAVSSLREHSPDDDHESLWPLSSRDLCACRAQDMGFTCSLPPCVRFNVRAELRTLSSCILCRAAGGRCPNFFPGCKCWDW